MSQEIAGIGYINEEREHMMISVREPSLTNCDRKDFVQVVVTIENAIILRAEINSFLERHGVRMN